jgi:multiple sugar transport system substrate-binding protein
MNSTQSGTNRSLPRRGFLALASASALSPLLAACGSDKAAVGAGSGQSAGSKAKSGVLKFWTPGRGTPEFATMGDQLVSSWKDGGFTAKYQVIPATNLFQTFQAAISAKIGPAVSDGYAFQAFQFADQGAIAYADHVFETMKSDGSYDDFLPGVVEPFKTSKGYAAVPWGLDMRVFWYRKSLLDKVGVAVPTDWPSLLAAGKALAKQGIYGFATAAGPGASYGGHALVSLMINNGGGLFDEDGKPNATYARNVEAMDFVREMIGAGMVDPASVSYTNQNLYDQWKNGKAGIGIANPSLTGEAGDTSGDLMVMSPLSGPHGEKGTLQYLNNVMMYTESSSQSASEAFIIWWIKQFKGDDGFFAHGVTGSLPVFKSVIALPAIQHDANTVKIIQEWQPVGKNYSARGTALFSGLASVDAGTAVNQFAQTMLAGKTDSKAALTTLQSGITSVLS